MNKKERVCDVDNIVEWRHVITILLALVTMVGQAQTKTATITGYSPALKDGTVAESSIDNVRVASDTVIGGHFTLTIPVEELAKSYLFLRGEGCPNHLMTIWLKPGVDVKVTGKDCLYPLWKVESPLQDLRPQDAGELGGLVSVMPSLLENYRTYAQS